MRRRTTSWFGVYEDKQLMHAMLDRWRVFAPVVFIAIQALQVIIAPMPGDVTGLLGGFVFGQWLGFSYSTLGLTIGSLGAFWVGRRLGATFVRARLRRSCGSVWCSSRRSGRHSLLHHLLDSGIAEGHPVLSLRCQSDAVLGLRRGVHPGSDAGNLGPLCPRRRT